MTSKRIALLWIGLLLSGCGGDDSSLTEYVADVNAFAGRASEQGSALITEGT